MHKREEHVKELQKKEEEMRQMFVVRVKEKESDLKEAEKEVSDPAAASPGHPSQIMAIRTCMLKVIRKGGLHLKAGRQ